MPIYYKALKRSWHCNSGSFKFAFGLVRYGVTTYIVGGEASPAALKTLLQAPWHFRDICENN